MVQVFYLISTAITLLMYSVSIHILLAKVGNISILSSLVMDLALLLTEFMALEQQEQLAKIYGILVPILGNT